MAANDTNIGGDRSAVASSVGIQEAAQEAADWFETATRGDTGRDEDSYTRTKDGAPEWVRDLVQSAHGDFLPDDWRYETIRNALEAIADWAAADPCGDNCATFADSQVDDYTMSRLAWVASHLSRIGYVDDIVSELGHSPEGIAGDIGMGQYAEAAEVYGDVLRALEARCDGDDA